MAKNIKDIQNKLWKAADTLRGNMSAEEYMHVILGILSLKYISDKYKKAIIKMESEGFTIDELDGEDDFYLQYDAFIVTNKASWEYIMTFANEPIIGEKLDEAFIHLENDNKILKGIFNKQYNKEGMDQNKLGEVVKIFSDQDFSSEQDEDLIGRIYEYFLGKFFRDRGQKGGEFYTPSSIVNLMVSVLKPISGTIYDPACGTGGILTQSKKYIKENKGDISRVMVFGQEFNNTTWKLAKLNLVLNGFPLVDADGRSVLGDKSADTFTDDQHKGRVFDYVMANPPFNLKEYGHKNLVDDNRFNEFGMPPSGNANYAWLSHMVYKLNNRGRAAIVLANGSLSTSSKQELEIRKNMIKANKIDAILELPDKLFYTTGIPACIWFFNNDKKTDKVLMISSTELQGNMVEKTLRELTSENIKNVVELFDKHENGLDIKVDGWAKSVSSKELEENDYSLVPGRYVGVKEEIIDNDELKLGIQNLTKDLIQLLDEFNDLKPDILKALEDMGNIK